MHTHTHEQELARIAPHVMYLFKRPKGIQATQFMAVVESLVTFAHNPNVFFEGFKALIVSPLCVSSIYIYIYIYIYI